MLVFDAAALLDVEHFSAFARSTFVRETIVGIHVGFIFLGLFTWVSTVNFLERRLLLSFDVKLGSYRSGFPFWTFFSCWLIASLLVALHVLTYTFDFEALAK